MKRLCKKGLLLNFVLCAGLTVFFTACPTSNSDGGGTDENSSGENLASYVYTKYSNGASDSRESSQADWKMANCHDPKLFQDDDGTYYVYATDASCGNIGKVGLHIRYSTDLVNWTGVTTSAIQGFWDEDFLAWEGFAASSSETVHNNSSYTTYTWAPTVIKQNGLYYMYHGVNAANLTSGKASSCIVLAIASGPKGPFYPANEISNFDKSTETRSNYIAKASDIEGIKSKLEELGVSYSQSFLVRYAYAASSASSTASLDGTTLTAAEYAKSDNGRFGCIDPEFVFDMADGSLKTFTIGENECYAMIYGSWMSGIALIYVDAVSLKPIYKDYSSNSKSSITVDDTEYTEGTELECSLDQANYEYYDEAYKGNYGCLGVRIAGGYGAGYEGAQLFYNSNTNYYYLITSCGGLDYEYRCTLSRSEDIAGPYLDAGGQKMVLTNTSTDENYYGNYHAIGSKIIGSHALSSEYSFRSQGGLSVLRAQNGKIIFACHSRTNFQEGYYFYLQCHQMFFNEDGWPVLNQNEYYSDYTDITDDGTESLCSISSSDIVGTYNSILTVRGTETDSVSNLGIYGASSVTSTVNTLDAVPTKSKKMSLNSDGSIGGTYGGSWTLADDGYSVTINLENSSGDSLGSFKGVIFHAVDWAKKGSSSKSRRTISFTTLNYDSTGESTNAGEFLWGNRTSSTEITTVSD